MTATGRWSARQVLAVAMLCVAALSTLATSQSVPSLTVSTGLLVSVSPESPVSMQAVTVRSVRLLSAPSR